MSYMTKSCHQLSEKTFFLMMERQAPVPSKIAVGLEESLLLQDSEGHGNSSLNNGHGHLLHMTRVTWRMTMAG